MKSLIITTALMLSVMFAIAKPVKHICQLNVTDHAAYISVMKHYQRLGMHIINIVPVDGHSNVYLFEFSK